MTFDDFETYRIDRGYSVKDFMEFLGFHRQTYYAFKKRGIPPRTMTHIKAMLNKKEK